MIYPVWENQRKKNPKNLKLDKEVYLNISVQYLS